jgi:kanamycin kinase
MDNPLTAARQRRAGASWSAQWNYGPGWEGCLLDAEGIDPDQRWAAYYRVL